MRHKAALPAVLALFFITCAFQTRTPIIPFPVTGTVTLSSDDDARRTFETIAQRAGLRVLFARNFQGATPVTFRADNMSVMGALNLLSKQTGSFWTNWDRETILVANDTPANRRKYERQFVAVITIPRGAAEGEVRNFLAARKTEPAVGNKIVVRNTPGGIEQTIDSIANLDPSSPNVDATVLPSTAEVFLTDGGSSSRSTPSKRAQLRLLSPGRVSLRVNETGREIYERLARMASLQVAFQRNYPRRTFELNVENLDFFDALDVLSTETGSFWQLINENTILVVEETQQNRRDFELHQVEIIRLSEGTTAERVFEIMNALRTALGLRGVYLYEPGKAILLKDTPSNLLIAEDLISILEGLPPNSKTVVADLSSGFAQTGSFRSGSSTRAYLKLKVSGNLPFKESADIRSVYESIAQTLGISVVFGRQFPTRRIDFDFDGLEAIEALDLLALQSQTFWQPLDERSILVVEDTQQNRRDFEVHHVKTICLPVKTTTAELNALMNVLRTSLSLRGIYQSAALKAIVIHDTPIRVELIEKVIRALVPSPNAIVVMTVPAPGFAETRFLRNAPMARSQLRLRPTGPISRQVNQDSRVSYETLAEMGGIGIHFDPRFTPGAPMPLRLQGTDIADALDQLSIQTGTYWSVLDPTTILVAPDTPEVRRQFDPVISRTVSLKSFSEGAAREVVDILRAVLSVRDVESNGASIVMRDTPHRIAIAEQIIANLDRP